MADSTKGVGETKKYKVYARNLARQPREFKIHGKWYRWNAYGTKGDTLGVTNVDLGKYAVYFEIRKEEEK